MLFVLLISGIIDFGVLLNARLSVSSMSRVLARATAAGATPAELDNLATQQDPVIGVTTDGFSGYCCDAGDAIVVTTTYYNVDPSTGELTQVAKAAPGELVEVKVAANGAEVITPFMRPIFGCTDGSQKHCFVPINAKTSMRVEPTPTATPGS